MRVIQAVPALSVPADWGGVDEGRHGPAGGGIPFLLCWRLYRTGGSVDGQAWSFLVLRSPFYSLVPDGLQRVRDGLSLLGPMLGAKPPLAPGRYPVVLIGQARTSLVLGSLFYGTG